jgi:outer membrane receptor protein involved in Fe transport
MKHQNHLARRHNRNLLCCALASCLAVAAPAAFAQSTSATIRGQVVVDSAPAANAQVTATNLATGLKRTVQSTSNGSYTLAGLPPGDYRIDVSAAGQTNSKNVTVMLGQTATLNLGVGGVAGTPAGEATTLGTIEVIGAALAETKTSEVATYVSQKQIEALPQASRNFLAFADTVPGMIFETGADDSSKLRGGAQNSNGINVFIDGVGQKNYVLKGGISGQDSSRGNPFPQLGIGEYKVITSNYKAEYDQIGSAAVIAVTRSGTNEFHGSVFGDYTDQDWRASSPAEERTGNKPDTKTEQYGAAVGGPIVQDQLFYFMTYEHKDITSPRSVDPGANFPLALLPPELAALTGPTSSPFDEDLWFGKLTWQPGDAHLIELSAKYRDEQEITGIGGTNTDSFGSSKDNTSTRVDLRYQLSSLNWLNDAHLTYEDESWNPRAITIGPGFNFVTPDNAGRQTILNVGGGRDFQDKGQKGWSLQDDFSYFGWEGHTIKTGIKYKSVEINAFEQQPYNPQYQVDLIEQLLLGNSTTATVVPYQVSFGAPLPGAGDRNITSRNKQFGVYFQDDWDVNDRLTLNLGLRYDYERTPGFEDYVTPAGLVTALQAWPNVHGPNVDYDINDYISTGSNRSAFDGAWQPRVGFSYDLTGDERHVVFGGAGRSYDRNLFDYLALEQSKSTFPSYQLSFNTPAHPCTVGVNNCYDFSAQFYDPAYLYSLVAANPNLGAEVNLINNDIKTPYSDQFSIGMRNSFVFWGHDWNTSATIAHIRSYDGIVFTLGNRWPDGSFRNPANPNATWGGQPWDFPIPGYGRLILADNGIETRLNTLLLSAEKVYTADSPWAVTIAYTYSNASENRLNAANSDEHYLFDYPNLDGQPFITSAGIPKQRLVTTGIVDLWGVTLSGKLTLATPTPKDSVNCHDTTSFDNCHFDKFVPPGNIGFKQFDLAVRKEWKFGNDMGLWIRGDLLNAFNWHNWTDYDTWRGGPSPDFNNNFAHRTGDGIVFPTRTFKLSAGFNW